MANKTNTNARPTTGPEAALLDSADDAREALRLLRSAYDRLAKFGRLPCSVFAFAALGQVAAAASEAVAGLTGEAAQ